MNKESTADKVLGNLILAVFFALVAIVIAAPFAAYGWWAYDDWTCGFKECRVIKEVPGKEGS